MKQKLWKATKAPGCASLRPREHLFRKNQEKIVHFSLASEGYNPSPSPKSADCADTYPDCVEPVTRSFPTPALSLGEGFTEVENRN